MIFYRHFIGKRDGCADGSCIAFPPPPEQYSVFYSCFITGCDVTELTAKEIVCSCNMFRTGKHEKCPIQISIFVILLLTHKLVSISDGHLLVATLCLPRARLQLEFVCVCVYFNMQIDRYTMKVCRV